MPLAINLGCTGKISGIMDFTISKKAVILAGITEHSSAWVSNIQAFQQFRID
jgi:hypothetical protein